ncbi:FAD-dependent monooxygenase [Streptomyces sp. NPDC002588]|uniref:FAD-dependent monooxygenase n=1 Tax=Streptomyces sp. NPDC002588 TaxID=3154419 RepID=UPI0033299C42
MTARRVHILGGGPAGLFAARLLALRCPDWHVRLYERNPPEETFGFAVGLTGGLLRALRQADPEMYDDITGAAHSFASGGFRLPQGDVRLGRFHSGAISRTRMLRLLLNGALDAGVKVEIGRERDVVDLLDDADLVIAADGVSSATRNRFREEFGAEVTPGRGRYIWCGGVARLDSTVFLPATTQDGLFVAHAYPYGETRSTFVIEASAETLDRAGFGDRQWSSNGESDDEALKYLSKAFSELLDGGSFSGNRSRWGRFNTVRCARWHHDKIVLLGDAAATAHPSLGSGTKIAMESAIALADALAPLEDEPVSIGLERFEASRRPQVERLQERATRSQLWWESFDIRRHLSPARMAVAYLSRAGAVSLDDLLTSDPQLVTQALADFAGVTPSEVPGTQLTHWVLSRPLDTPHHRHRHRFHSGAGSSTPTIHVNCPDAWGATADTLVQQARELVRQGAHVIHLTGEDTRSALLDRLALGERIRTELPAVVDVTSSPSLLHHAADGVVAGRTDLVHVTERS